VESSIKDKARELGFSACGIAKAEAVDAATKAAYERWLAEEHQGDMDYLARNLEKRFDPKLLVPGCRSLIVTAINYYPAEQIPDSEWQIAYYAYGKDYHTVVKDKLFQLLEYMNSLREQRGEHPPFGEQRVFVDSAPVLERYWAQRAGLGWEGRNHLLIIPGMGSWFFLGIILTDLDLKPDKPQTSRCGICRRCVDACPAGALTLSGDGTTSMDARRCISYITIERKEPGPSDFSAHVGNSIYGCDRCQKVCPWNRFAVPSAEPLFRASDALLAMRRSDWLQMTPDTYEMLFKGSAVRRAKFEGLQRNIKTVSDVEKKVEKS